MPCSFCKRDLEPVSGGLCNACYQRKRKRGSPDYAPVRVRGKCTLRGCDRPHAARGMCYMLWERWKATGNPQETKRPDSWGANTKHPLYGSWDHMRRKRHITPIAPQWDDFLQFAHDVGARPEPGAKLFVANDTQPIGPGNFVWKRSITQRVDGEDEATFQRRRLKIYRGLRREDYEETKLKKTYGLTRQQMLDMQEAQGHLCPICLRPETNARFHRLAIDHCHKSGKVRGLLCSSCNKALGAFEDDPERLKRAITYLSLHQ
jgi:hypothetical protein